MPDRPAVTVVVATRNRQGDLRRTLDRLTALPERPAVIVVDNASGDGSPAMVRREFPGVELVALPRNLAAAGRNVGCRLARTELVAFSDDDSWWDPGALSHAARTLAARPDVAVVAGRVLVGDEGALDPVSRAMGGEAPGPVDPHGLAPVTGFLACGAVVRRRPYLAAGGFDPLLGIGAEEEALTLALQAAGWRLVYDPAVVARHHPSPSRRPGERRRQQVRNEQLVAWMHLPPRQAARRTLRALLAPPGHRAAVVDALRLAPAARRRRRAGPRRAARSSSPSPGTPIAPTG